jgi:hypothetical protein
VDVRLRAPLDDPKAVFGAVGEVEGWEETPSGYALTVSDPDRAAPAQDVYLELIDEDVEAKSR